MEPVTYSVLLPLKLNMFLEAFLELDNKTTHGLAPVMNGHCPFFTGVFDRKVNHFLS